MEDNENKTLNIPDIIREIRKITQPDSFLPLEKKTNSKSQSWVQWGNNKTHNIGLHYEIIACENKIYAEFHVEPENNVSRDMAENIKLSLKKEFENVKNISISDWYNLNNGLAIRLGDGVAVADHEDFEKLKNELSGQMKELYEKLGGKAIFAKISNIAMKYTLKKLLKNSKQLILTGAPGTGKTRLATEIAKEMTEDGGEYTQVQFHPGYDYSDFIIGLKPKVTPDGKTVTFEWKDGVFKEFADKALTAYKADVENAKPYIFIIDEINRADLSRVFGEVFSLLEEDYRCHKKDKGITLPNGKDFILSPNLYIIGTMNDIDRSVESMDFALRRRFSWKEVTAEDSVRIIYDSDITSKEVLEQVMAELNKYIGGIELEIDKQKVSLNLGNEYKLGGAYFKNFSRYQGKDGAWDKLWNNHIAIILNEYLRGHSLRSKIMEALRDKYDKICSLPKQNTENKEN